MNKLTIIGNVTKDPELRSTPSGKSVCTFTVAVHRRKKVDGQQSDTDFFRVTTWDGTAENCAKYATKGKKICVVVSVSVYAYTNSKGEAGASLEVNASEIEFLSPRGGVDQQTGYMKVDDTEVPY